MVLALLCALVTLLRAPTIVGDAPAVVDGFLTGKIYSQ